MCLFQKNFQFKTGGLMLQSTHFEQYHQIAKKQFGGSQCMSNAQFYKSSLSNINSSIFKGLIDLSQL